MARTKFFRVAVEGPTVDGRKIERAHIEQMAASYDPDTYTARINIEHLRGYGPNPPFNAYGSVAAVEAREIELVIDGKKQKRLALYAAFDINDQAIELNKADQKIFSSVEINPNFADTHKAYLVGIAFTDSPASLATQVLKFSSDDRHKDLLVGIGDEFAVELDEDSATASEVTGAFTAMKKFFENLTSPRQDPATPPAPPPSATQPATELAGFAAAMTEGLDKLATAFTAANARTEARMAQITADFRTLKADIEKTPARGYTARPTGTGGGDRVQADC